MGAGEASLDSASPTGARHAAIDHLRTLLREAAYPAWATPALVALGLATSFAETLGITLIVAFLYAAMGQAAVAASAVGGWLGEALTRALGMFGSPSRLALAILILILARAGLSHLNRRLAAYIGELINEAARNRLHEQFLTVSYGQMQRYPEAQLIEVLGNESWLISEAYSSLTRVIIGICSISVFAAFLVALSWPIALAAVAGSVVLALVLRRLARPAQMLGREVKRVHQELGRHMLVSVQGLRTIRAYGQERTHQSRFVRSSAQGREASYAQARLSALLDPITEVAYLAMLSVIIMIALRWGIALATLLAATALLYRLQPHVRDVEGHLLHLAQLEPRLRSVRAILAREDKTYDRPGHRAVSELRQGIRFEAVCFAYEAGAPNALDSVSLEIPAGRTTALAGPSGAGKTTLVNLLLRLYEPQAGTILVDGVPLHELKRADWLGLLAVAGQDVDLVEGTVLDNIRMADANATTEAVLEAARAAGVDEFVKPLPEGYDTWIGQQGHRFSGGQRQRLGLARALLRRPQLLILDEATSALDDELDRRIRAAISERLAGHTVIVVSHRESALHAADHVVRLDRGRVVVPPRTTAAD